MSAQHPPVSTIICSLMTPLAMFVLGTGLQVDTESEVPTAIERALIERACSATSTPPSAQIDLHRQCLSARLLSLRADFGRDLSRLSSSNRKTIDAACARLRPAERREAYLDCIRDQLVALRMRQNPGEPSPSKEAAAPSPLTALSGAPAPPARQASLWPSATVIGGTVASAIAAAGVVFLAVRSRRARRTCRICGANVPDSDLCPTCRHEAAEALRLGVLERAHNQRAAQQEEERRQREDEAEQREPQARDDEEARTREQELANQREEAARQRQAEQVHRESHAIGAPIVPAVDGEAFDPYVVLGVQREATQEGIRAAYQQAKTKYDSDLVSYLGDEAQGHFREKAQAVERAYQMLLDARP